MIQDWTTLEDGGSGSWMYCREVASGVYVFIYVIDEVEYCGRDAEHYYSSEVSVVDLNQAAKNGSLYGALRSCDAKSWAQDLNPEQLQLLTAQCCHSYGAYSPLWSDVAGKIDKGNKDWQWEDRSPDEAIEAAVDWAEGNVLEGMSRDLLMDTTIVNKLGQTAREYAGGTQSLWDTLRCIRDNPEATDEQRLVLKMYGACEHTLDAGPIPKDLQQKESPHVIH